MPDAPEPPEATPPHRPTEPDEAEGSRTVEATKTEGADAGEHLPSGVEGGHGGPRVADRTVVWQLFVGMGLFVVVIAIVYWFTSYEDAGSVLLLLAAVLGLWFGAFLWLQQRRPTPAADADVEGPAAVYLPHASVWPLVIGLGAASIANGLVLGTWVVVPGLAALGLGIGGFVRQSRHHG